MVLGEDRRLRRQGPSLVRTTRASCPPYTRTPRLCPSWPTRAIKAGVTASSCPSSSPPTAPSCPSTTAPTTPLQRALRSLGERGFALLTERWRALQHTTLSPSKFGSGIAPTQSLARPHIAGRPYVMRGVEAQTPNEQTSTWTPDISLCGCPSNVKRSPRCSNWRPMTSAGQRGSVRSPSRSRLISRLGSYWSS